jgi:hypothetical protein
MVGKNDLYQFIPKWKLSLKNPILSCGDLDMHGCSGR